ncbi:MAG TPA: hypothetical protein VIV60_13135 [Polyangiaceae bacterium]
MKQRRSLWSMPTLVLCFGCGGNVTNDHQGIDPNLGVEQGNGGQSIGGAVLTSSFSTTIGSGGHAIGESPMGSGGQRTASYTSDTSDPYSGQGGQITNWKGFGGMIAAGGSSQELPASESYGGSVVTHLDYAPIAVGDPLQMVYRVTWSSGEPKDYVFSTDNIGTMVRYGCSEQGYHVYFVSGSQYNEVGHLSIELSPNGGASAKLRDSSNHEIELIGSMELLEGPETGSRTARGTFRFQGRADASIVVEGSFTAVLIRASLLC